MPPLESPISVNGHCESLMHLCLIYATFESMQYGLCVPYGFTWGPEGPCADMADLCKQYFSPASDFLLLGTVPRWHTDRFSDVQTESGIGFYGAGKHLARRMTSGAARACRAMSIPPAWHLGFCWSHILFGLVITIPL